MLYLYITQIPPKTTEREVSSYFSKFGSIEKISVAKGKGEWKKLNARIEIDSKYSYKAILKQAHFLNRAKIHVEPFLSGDDLEQKRMDQASRRISLFKIKGKISIDEIVRKLSYHGNIESHHFIKYKEKKDKKYGFVTFEDSATAQYWIEAGKITVKNIDITIKPYKGPGQSHPKNTQKSIKKSKKTKKQKKTSQKALMRRGHTEETQGLVNSSNSLSNRGFDSQEDRNSHWEPNGFRDLEYKRERPYYQMPTPSSINTASGKIRRRRNVKLNQNNERVEYSNNTIRQIARGCQYLQEPQFNAGNCQANLPSKKIDCILSLSLRVHSNHRKANLRFNRPIGRAMPKKMRF